MPGGTNIGDHLFDYKKHGLTFFAQATNDDREVEVHLSEPTTDKTHLTFESPKHQKDKQSVLIRDLLGIHGIVSIHQERYCITIRRAEVFPWEDLLGQVQRVIVRHFEAHTINQEALVPHAKGRKG